MGMTVGPVFFGEIVGYLWLFGHPPGDGDGEPTN
jgi:hypothetical protein